MFYGQIGIIWLNEVTWNGRLLPKRWRSFHRNPCFYTPKDERFCPKGICRGEVTECLGWLYVEEMGNLCPYKENGEPFYYLDKLATLGLRGKRNVLWREGNPNR